ncbi:GNAT family N-acetyltransferase [Maribacter sp. 2-571]|uniref:GNAT family N-acetyltransferase n=1 Tax=Maribacter sp. 2-571 TaxID=3417569 RepID=UPI003D34FA76
MDIRYAQKKDLTEIVALCRAHALFERASYDPTNKSTLLADALFGNEPRLRCLVLEEENRLMGYATFIKQFSTWDAAYYMYLDCLFLRESSRGKGWGSLLMDRVLTIAKKENCSSMQWQTPDFNSNAIAFYQKLGATSKTKERFELTIPNL